MLKHGVLVKNLDINIKNKMKSLAKKLIVSGFLIASALTTSCSINHFILNFKPKTKEIEINAPKDEYYENGFTVYKELTGGILKYEYLKGIKEELTYIENGKERYHYSDHGKNLVLDGKVDCFYSSNTLTNKQFNQGQINENFSRLKSLFDKDINVQRIKSKN